MPAPKNPLLPEFFVYRLEVGDVPFYVGVGRAARASDRVRYVRYLMSREARGLPVTWNLSCGAVAELLRAGCEVTVAHAAKGLPRSAAAAREREEIARLVAAGTVLANKHHNPRPPQSAGEVAQAVLERVAAQTPNKAL